MNQLCDLQAQNLHDCWSLLYISLANAVYASGDSGAESVLRQSVRNYGTAEGEQMRRRHEELGAKVNLDTCYQSFAPLDDPRLYVETQRLNEQVALFNVVRCPFAMIMRLRQSEHIGKVFCEEYTPALIMAYTNNIAQVNISECLNEPKDTHCRIAAYFRPANVMSDAFHSHFTAFDEVDVKGYTPPSQGLLEYWNTSADMLVKAFTLAGIKSETVEEGLEQAAVQIARFLTDRANSTGQAFGSEFARNNSPLFDGLLAKREANETLSLVANERVAQ